MGIDSDLAKTPLTRKGQINISLDPRVFERMGQEAAKAGLSRTAYAATLLNAAWAARFGKSMDPELDRVVSGVLLLNGIGYDAAKAAETLRVEPQVVEKILRVWSTYPRTETRA